MLATDLFTLNSALGAMIEEQVVSTLNSMRPVWDPNKEYQSFAFSRQPQTFPDVLLRKTTNSQQILLGIELKGWYMLAKERVPNFRFVATPDACQPWDLIVVIPWVLSNVLSGTPAVYHPFIELAHFAALQRNYYWQHERQAQGDSTVILATGIGPYPSKGDKISDRAVSDAGGNFGRLARYAIMKDYVEGIMATELRGVPVKDWLAFFTKHAKE
ncbi:MAG TPA: hypothetical protein VGZ26_00875 [Pirellulales bacterium]|jgi:hypothetical protein|nr:hypothetical protein [Pirellulales bacterium]